MNDKQIALTLIGKLPEDVTLTDIARKTRFVAGVRQGLQELDRGEGFSADAVLKQIPKRAKTQNSRSK
ncbi:MAG: hypothetical protein ABSA47_07500 [Verrucomicrobiota bacterium]|jgi:predicted transcriptional regulator